MYCKGGFVAPYVSGFSWPMVLEGPLYLHECEIIKGTLEYEFNIEVIGEKEIFYSGQHHSCKRRLSSCSEQSRSRVDLGFVCLVCSKDLMYFPRCLLQIPRVHPKDYYGSILIESCNKKKTTIAGFPQRTGVSRVNNVLNGVMISSFFLLYNLL